jgi:hypothetical protein
MLKMAGRVLPDVVHRSGRTVVAVEVGLRDRLEIIPELQTPRRIRGEALHRLSERGLKILLRKQFHGTALNAECSRAGPMVNEEH